MLDTVKNDLAMDLARTLARHWWVVLLRGLVAIAFGVLTFTRPALSLAALLWFFGVFVFADGLLHVWTAVTDKEHENRWLLLLGGLLGIGVGLLAFITPGLPAIAVLFYIAVWAVATGLLDIVAAVRLRKEIQGEWMLGLGGLCSVAFGVVLIARPAVGALAVLWIIAAYAVAFGVILTLLSFRLKGLAKKVA
jgi:uncharacterized membrane protein HdeD (DUF308 family)